jgi:hypothetical protein
MSKLFLTIAAAFGVVVEEGARNRCGRRDSVARLANLIFAVSIA